MTCERCGGLSVAAHFEGNHAWQYDGWECLICGNITDPLIMTNRDAQAHGAIGPMTSHGSKTCARRSQSSPAHRYSSVISQC